MSIRTRSLISVIAAGLALVMAPTHAAIAADTSGDSDRQAVAGRWNNPDPLTITSSSQHHGITTITFTGSSLWTGDLLGRTSFTGHGRINRHGVLSGALVEQFTGRVREVGQGTLSFSERFRIDLISGALLINARITGGTSQLSHLHGTLRFTGTSDAQGVGQGPFTGSLSEPED
jgi:hypothetical protein